MKTQDRGSVVDDVPDRSLVYDCGTGKFRGKGQPARTAVEAVMTKDPPPPLRPVDLPDIPPLEADIAHLASANGWDREKAAHSLRQQNKLAQARQRIVSPGYALITETLHANGVEALTQAATRVREQAAKIGGLENLLRVRNELLVRLAADKSSLAHAQQQLAAPAALDLPEGQLVTLNNQVRHLPARIAEQQAKADALEAEIGALAKAGDIDVKAVVASQT